MRLLLWRGSGRSLSARGHFLKTFAGIGYCLAFSLLAVGAYGMEEQFAPWPAPISCEEESAIIRSATSSEGSRRAIPLHGRYVDRAFVRIQR